MNKYILIILLLISSLSWSQGKINVFAADEITFYGLDYSHAKCVGSELFPSPEELISKYFPHWNDMFMSEENGFDMSKPFKKKEVLYDTLLYIRNLNIEKSGLITDEPLKVMDRSTINKYMSEFNENSQNGLGLVYLVEALNAEDKYLSVWIVFFDMQSGEVLLSEPLRVKGKGRKFGLWWEAAYNELYNESKDAYKDWRKIYN